MLEFLFPFGLAVFFLAIILPLIGPKLGISNIPNFGPMRGKIIARKNTANPKGNRNSEPKSLNREEFMGFLRSQVPEKRRVYFLTKLLDLLMEVGLSCKSLQCITRM